MDINILEPYVEAIATIKNHGHIKFQDLGEETQIIIDVYGFKPGKHGFHIHEKGTIEKGCGSLCAHYNPFNTKHGGPDDDRNNRHVGDLGNIDVDVNGICKTSFSDTLVKLSGEYSVLNRSIVIHEDEDDLGKGGDEESLKTGNAGKRIACARIELVG
jgi:Cu-Zn family superoxide dismutase